MTSYLFIYGTLLLTDNEFGQYLRKNSVSVGKGKFRGKLFDVGNYPAAIADEKVGTFVTGSVVKFKNKTVFDMLDPYEGIGDDQPQPWLYVRELVDIETENGILQCWVYLYNHPTENLKLIPSGDYLSYIQ